MDTTKQRIAIHEALGWTLTRGNDMTMVRDVWNREDGSWDHECPDYLNDLNAMHEAEKVLTKTQQIQFALRLAEIVGASIPGYELGAFKMMHATATQRAEAFLRTLGKWEE